MAKFLDLNSDRCLILNSREALHMPFQFKDWTNIQLCLAVDWVNPVYENLADPRTSAEISTESRQVISNKDRLYIGLKDDSVLFPGSSNASFIGASVNVGSNSTITNPGSSTPNNISISNLAKTVILPNQTITQANNENLIYLVYGNPANYSFIFLEFLVLNKGLSNQQIRIGKYETQALANWFTYAEGSPTREKIDNLRTNSVFNGYHTFDFNVGGVPVKLPNSIFAYAPWTNKKMRIYSLAVINLD